jgi:3-phenylpropionate/cinnamic acid dioxygenase small subunit
VQLDELARAVKAQADRSAILDVVAAYATALDTKDWMLLESLFTADARVQMGGSVGTATGATQIAALLRTTLEPLDATQHLLGNSVVRIDGDDAEHAAYVQGQHVRHDAPGGELYVVAGRYDDRLRRTPDGWQFTSRSLTRMWRDGNPAVLHS